MNLSLKLYFLKKINVNIMKKRGFRHDTKRNERLRMKFRIFKFKFISKNQNINNDLYLLYVFISLRHFFLSNMYVLLYFIYVKCHNLMN